MSLPETIEDAHKLITDLRAENAQRRVRSKAYEEAFSDFSDQEQDFLLSLVTLTAKDSKEGARAFRDLAFQMMQQDPEAFLEGLDIAPPAAPAAEDTTNEEEAEVAGLTEAQLQAVLDERERKATEARDKAEQEAAIEGIYAEIEALGFERGTEGFATILSLGNTQAQLGKDVDFKALAPTVAQLVGLDLPGATNEEALPEAREIPDAPEGSGKPHASTADAGGAGGAPTETGDPNWAATAIKEGRDPLAIARERAEARMAGTLT